MDTWNRYFSSFKSEMVRRLHLLYQQLQATFDDVYGDFFDPTQLPL